MLTAKEAKRMTETVRINLEESFRATVLPEIEKQILEAVRNGNYFTTITVAQEHEHITGNILRQYGYVVNMNNVGGLDVHWRQ